jgi:hypothetical protein
VEQYCSKHTLSVYSGETADSFLFRVNYINTDFHFIYDFLSFFSVIRIFSWSGRKYKGVANTSREKILLLNITNHKISEIKVALRQRKFCTLK